MSDIFLVTKRLHQAMVGFRILLEAKACLLDALTPSKVRQRWNNNMEGHAIAALFKCGQYLGCFEITTGPAMAKEQRNGVGRIRSLMKEVDIQLTKAVNMNAFVEVWKLIELLLLSPPIVLLLPVFGETLYIGERSAIVPGCAIQL